jgi:predicted transcriptional regulator
MTNRLNMRLPCEVTAVMDRLAAERGLTRTAIVREALGVLRAAHDGAKQGHYIGLTKNPENLDMLLVAPL